MHKTAQIAWRREEVLVAKTDKTRPMWVKMMDPHNRRWVEEWHDHARGTFRRPLDNCTLTEAHPRDGWRSTKCCYWISYYGYHAGAYPRPSKYVERYVYKMRRTQRACWRLAARDMVKSSRAEIYDNEYHTGQHRHSARWLMY